MGKKFLAVILALCMAVSLCACGKSASGSDTATNSGTAAGGDEAKTIHLGVFEPASGDNGAGGKQETLGIEYANSVCPTVEVNGETYNVKLEVVDNESSNDKAPTAASTLASKNCSVVLGSYGSSVSIAGSAVFEEAGIPVIGVTCTNPQVTEGNKHYFRICFIDPFQGTALANYAFGELKAHKAYCLSKLGDDYSGGLVNYFVKAFEALGGECVQETFPDGNSDFTSYIANAKNQGCDVFFSPVSIEAAQLIIDQASAQGMTLPILAGDTWDSNVVLQAAKGKDISITVTTFYPEGADPTFDNGFKEWVNADSERLTKNGGDDTVSAVTAMGYDAYYFALEAIKNAGSIDPSAVMQAIWTTEYDGVSGHIALDQTNGDAIRDTAYVKHCNNETGAWEGLPAFTITNGDSSSTASSDSTSNTTSN